jgi:hypothetical protein
MVDTSLPRIARRVKENKGTVPKDIANSLANEMYLTPWTFARITQQLTKWYEDGTLSQYLANEKAREPGPRTFEDFLAGTREKKNPQEEANKFAAMLRGGSSATPEQDKLSQLRAIIGDEEYNKLMETVHYSPAKDDR